VDHDYLLGISGRIFITTFTFIEVAIGTVTRARTCKSEERKIFNEVKIVNGLHTLSPESLTSQLDNLNYVRY
jgi:hypothetical protein